MKKYTGLLPYHTVYIQLLYAMLHAGRAGIQEAVAVAEQRGRGVLHPDHGAGDGHRAGASGDLPAQASHGLGGHGGHPGRSQLGLQISPLFS